MTSGAVRWLRLAVIGTAAGLALFGESFALAAKPRAVVKPRGLGFYGGGNLNQLNPEGMGDGYVDLVVSKDRRRVTIEPLIDCRAENSASVGLQRPPTAPTVALAANGRFRGSAVYPLGNVERETLSFSGHFTSPERAVGTVRFRVVGLTDPTLDCDSGNMPFEVDDPALPLGSGAFSPGTEYYGTNDARAPTQAPPNFGRLNKFPMMLRTASRGRSVALLSYYYQTHECQPIHIRIPVSEVGGPAPTRINRNGSFTERDHFMVDLRGLGIAKFRSTVTGRFGRTRVNGTLRADVAVVASDGTIVLHCSTGNVPWAAVR
jgi:hypothetical protein